MAKQKRAFRINVAPIKIDSPKTRALLSGASILIAASASMASNPPFNYYNEYCGNGVDDDFDGYADCEDFDCSCNGQCGEIPAGCFPTELCGNGLLDLGELCDDGNTNPGDGCSSDCLGLELCGDGRLDPINGEICDDGNNLDNDACSADCSTVTGTGFSSDPINGFTPETATTTIFGEASISTANGAPAQALLVVASNDPAICDTITSSQVDDGLGNTLTGLDAFISKSFAGDFTSTNVLLFVEKNDPTPFSAGSFFHASGGFIVGDGASLLTGTALVSFNDLLTIQSIDATNIIGQFNGLQTLDLATGASVNTPLTGIFTGTSCPAITDGIPGTFGQ